MEVSASTEQPAGETRTASGREAPTFKVLDDALLALMSQHQRQEALPRVQALAPCLEGLICVRALLQTFIG